MADAREQSMAGHAPIDPIFEDRGQDGPGIGDARSVKVDMGQGLPPVRRPAARSGSTSGAVVVFSAVLALVFGGAGAWAYERYLAHPRAERTADASTMEGRDSEIQKNLAQLDGRIKGLSDQCNNLSDQYKQLQARLEKTPKPAPSPDLAPIEEKVARVDPLSQQVEAIGKKLDPLPEQLMQYKNKVTELDTKLDELRKELSVAHDRAGRPKSGGLVDQRRSSFNGRGGRERTGFVRQRRVVGGRGPRIRRDPISQGAIPRILRPLPEAVDVASGRCAGLVFCRALLRTGLERLGQNDSIDGRGGCDPGEGGSSEKVRDRLHVRRLDQGDWQGLARFLP